MTNEQDSLKTCPICGSELEHDIEISLKPEAVLHMLEDIDRLAESGNADGTLCRALIKAGHAEVFDAYALLFGMGLVDPDDWR